ncbi:Tfp pilus assembly protein FimT/FimU [Microcoleus sp. FACHB-1515]|uniref:pilus assembly FimT family protein n=2 Tax=Cyanophyceae TaxID=3028117 RepID=UPI001A7EA501|nr:hypothetical protein [Microcoleus sp. FACHB-1515]
MEGLHQDQRRYRFGSALRSAGFTLAEQVCIMALLGVLLAIAAPSWLTFFRYRQLVAAQERSAMAIRSVQHQASLSRTQQAIAFRQTSAGIEWSVYPASGRPADWQSLSDGVAIDPNTTLERQGEFYRLRFNEDGHVVGLLGRLTLAIEGTSLRRCVWASTLLGELRRADGDRCTR